MSHRSTVSPSTLPVDLREEGVVVEYLDGRETFYRGVPEKVEDAVRTRPGVLVQVLVLDPTGTDGVLTYVNDRSTHDDILEDTGVGRVFVEPGETNELFPGVTARADGHAVVVEADPETAGGRVFVFAEDELQERSYELVRSDRDGDDVETDGRTDGGEDGNEDGADGGGDERSVEDDGAGGDESDGDGSDGDDVETENDETDTDDPGSVEEGTVDSGRVDRTGDVDEDD